MANKLRIIRNTATGEPVIFETTRQGDFGDIVELVSFVDATIGELVNGTTTIDYPQLGGLDFTFTLDTHDSDKGIVGATAHAELINLTRHEAHEHGAPPPAIPLWAVELNKLAHHHVAFTERFSAIESILAMLMQESDTVYTYWEVRGTEFICGTADKEDGYASVNLASNFIGKSHPVDPKDDSNTEHILRIKTDLGVLTIRTAVQELGKVQDAIKANDTVNAVHSAPHPKPVAPANTPATPTEQE